MGYVEFTWGMKLLSLPNPKSLGGFRAINAISGQCGIVPSAESHETEWKGARRGRRVPDLQTGGSRCS